MEPLGDPQPSIWEVERQRTSFFRRLLARLGLQEDWLNSILIDRDDGNVAETTPPALEEALRDQVALPQLCQLVDELEPVLAVDLLAFAARDGAAETGRQRSSTHCLTPACRLVSQTRTAGA